MLIEDSGQQFLNQQLIIKKSGVGNRMKIAELGCGSTGFFVFPLAQIVGKEGMVYAVDIIKSSLDSIEKKAKLNNLKQIKTIWSNLEIFNATKIEAESLDLILLINVLHQSTKRVDIVREVIRMLKRGGKMLVVEWNEVTCAFGPPNENKVKIDLLKQGLTKLGMKQEEEFLAGNYHYGLLFSKY
jgi:ubiquinone/menaquinone biosynthesis C-methylase UbiE